MALSFEEQLNLEKTLNTICLLGQSKVRNVENFLPFFKVCETSTNQISRLYHERLPNVKFYYYVKIHREIKFFLQHSFSLRRNFIESTTAAVVMLLQV